MDTTKIITLTIIGIVSIAISLTVTQLFLIKQKLKSENEGKTNISYAVFFSTWVIAFSLLNLKSISVLSEYIDLINKTNTEISNIEILKTTVLFIGLTNFWLIIWYFIAQIFTLIFVGKRNDINEIESNNYGYFVLKGILILSFIYSLIPVFEILLRTFFPIEVPFYR